MGAGRIVYQELTRITKEIEDGEFFKNEALLAGMENVKKNGSKLFVRVSLRRRRTQPYYASLRTS